ncbi:MAG: glycosyltransferase family 9 protein [Actinophytocola sp.]|uniref:glycosyltransferase family 9 protein n=1 Tax=Actinophytocola sp. TaxID=1872138 RepID=UPI0013281518|nr:glycosyltransferase family 9 protein [Actinophytocola sp.]MPZ81890.1 glycosyltransferase family 9 protein [Actinophytocola sp.]
MEKHGRALVARLDSNGDVLLAGPAVRAAAATHRVTLLCGPSGEQAARLLPGVDDLLVWRCPWIVADPPATRAEDLATVVDAVRRAKPETALILTSFHQSPLPLALLLRLAGVPQIAAICPDYPGSLLDHRLPDTDLPEPERALGVAVAAGFSLPPGDTGELQVLAPPDVSQLVGSGHVVVHPGATAPARVPSPHRTRAIVAALAEHGHRVVVTGGPAETELTAEVAGPHALDLGGRITFAELAGVLAAARVVVVGNTAAAHLAAAVGTPVVSLFAPVVPAIRWAPYRVAHVLLGDQDAPCAGTRTRTCPVPGHPCLDTIAAAEVVAAVDSMARAAA